MTDQQRHAEVLYDRYARALVAFASSIVGPADAEDVVASVAARIFSAAALRSADNEQAFLYQAVRNAARSHLRSQGRRQRREQRVAFDRARVPSSAEAGGPDLSHLLDALSPNQRSVVHLTYWEGLTGREVAQRLDMSEGSVRTHLARAKHTLRVRIGEGDDR